MSKDIDTLLREASNKVVAAIGLVEASLKKVEEFAPTKNYTPDEQELDAACAGLFD